MINIPCPGCDQMYHADEIHSGREFKCTKCGRILRVPVDRTAPRRSDESDSDKASQAWSDPLGGRSKKDTHSQWIAAVIVGTLIGLAIGGLIVSEKSRTKAVSEPTQKYFSRAAPAPSDPAAEDSPKTP